MVIIAIIIFSTFEVVSKTMGDVLSGTALTFYRFLIGGLVLLPFSIRDLKNRQFHFTPKIVLALFFFGFVLVAAIMTLAQYGIYYSDASICAVIFSSNPIFVTIFAVIILKESLTKYKSYGLIIGSAGLFICVLHFFVDGNITSTFGLGVLLQILSMLMFCIYTVLNSKYLVSRMGALSVTTFTSIFGAITLFPIVFAQSFATDTNLFTFDVLSVLPKFLYISIIGTGLAYAMYFSGLSKIETSTGSMIFMAKPPLASIFAAIFLNETIGINIIIGIVLIIAAMIIATKLPTIQKGHEYEKTRDYYPTGESETAEGHS
ncbi:DMT family transporter [Eubacterium oxidoreducens]|nr:EamA family transporter [Eubacterium oxidoreducens]